MATPGISGLITHRIEMYERQFWNSQTCCHRCVDGDEKTSAQGRHDLVEIDASSATPIQSETG